MLETRDPKTWKTVKSLFLLLMKPKVDELLIIQCTDRKKNPQTFSL